MGMELQGRIALVTGGSEDIGAAIARALAQAGASVAVSYVGERERAEKVAAEVTALGRRAWTVRLDQADAAMPEHVIAATVAHFGRLDVLVNNAAWNIGIPFADLEALTPEIWDRMYATNVRGPFLLARGGPPVAGAGGRAHRQHRLGRGPLSVRQQPSVRHEQGGPDPPDALPGRGVGPRCAGQLRGSRPGRRDAQGAASAGADAGDGRAERAPGADRQVGGHRRPSRRVLPLGQRHGPGPACRLRPVPALSTTRGVDNRHSPRRGEAASSAP